MVGAGRLGDQWANLKASIDAACILCFHTANKRAEESSMWAAYERQKALGRGERSLERDRADERTPVHSSERRDEADPSPSLSASGPAPASTSQSIAARHVVR